MATYIPKGDIGLTPNMLAKFNDSGLSEIQAFADKIRGLKSEYPHLEIDAREYMYAHFDMFRIGIKSPYLAKLLGNSYPPNTLIYKNKNQESLECETVKPNNFAEFTLFYEADTQTSYLLISQFYFGIGDRISIPFKSIADAGYVNLDISYHLLNHSGIHNIRSIERTKNLSYTRFEKLLLRYLSECDDILSQKNL